MKQKLFLILAGTIFLSHNVFSQGMPVYDNTNFLALGKSLIESAKQTSELLKTANFLKEQKEKIEKVNAVIKQLQAVKEITGNNQRLFEMVRDDLQEILSSPYIRAEEVERVSRSFNTLMEMGTEDLDFMQQLLRSNVLNMTDAQRLEILNQQKQRSRIMLSEIEYKKRRYHAIISFRKNKERIQNRDMEF